MPSTKKTIHFLSCALVSAVSVGLTGFSMSTQWAKSTMECEGNLIANGSAVVILKLFEGVVDRDKCPGLQDEKKFQVVPKLAETGGAPVVLHALVLLLLVLSLLFSAITMLIALYNSVSNPYVTFMGPRGIYGCSSVSIIGFTVILVIYPVNVSATNMVEKLVMSFAGATVALSSKSAVMQLGYFLIIVNEVLSALAIVLICTYECAAYTRRKEQQKPTEDAPKEIMMY